MIKKYCILVMLKIEFSYFYFFSVQSYFYKCDQVSNDYHHNIKKYNF